MYKFVSIFVIAALLSGCAGIRNVIGSGALTVKTAAEIVQRECGNTVPDGPCLATSRITTTEKNEFKIRLQSAQDLLVDAAQLDSIGRGDEAATKLETADAILAALEQILRQRSIE